MCIRKSLMAGAATVAMMGAGAALAGVEGPTEAMFAGTTDWGPENLDLPQFDEMGGARTLTSITIEWTTNIGGNIRLESQDATPGTVTGRMDATININGPEVSETTMPFVERSFDAAADDGNIDFGGPSGMSFDGIVGDAVGGMVVLNNPGDFGPFLGAGMVTYIADASGETMASGPGNVTQQFSLTASVVVSVTYNFDEDTTIVCDPNCDEPNDVCDPLDIEGSCTIHDYVECGQYINETLEKRVEQGCEPDTYIVLFDKNNNFINKDDNGSNKGNGWASGLFGVGLYDSGNPLPYGDGGDGFIDNGDGTFSLRIGVTGRADGLDTTFNGLFMNAPHGQLGKFRLTVTFLDGAGEPLENPVLPNDGGFVENPAIYDDEFNTGAEAFHINYILPLGTVSVDICIDNVIACEPLLNDVDFFCIENLVPLCDYCIIQVGGLDEDCVPTATAIGWFDKSCELILKEAGNSIIPGYTELCFVADVNGRAIIAVSGANDCNFNGLDDASEIPAAMSDRALSDCPEPTPGHGVAGCYTLSIEVAGDHGDTTPPDGGNSGDVAAMQEALNNGDVNMDGVTNTADLGVIIGNFGWTSGL